VVFGKDINVAEHKILNFKSVSVNFKVAKYSHPLINYKLNPEQVFLFFLTLFLFAQASLFH